MRANEKICQDAPWPADSACLASLRIRAVGCRRTEPDVAREVQLDGDRAGREKAIERRYRSSSPERISRRNARSSSGPSPAGRGVMPTTERSEGPSEAGVAGRTTSEPRVVRANARRRRAGCRRSAGSRRGLRHPSRTQ
jgi:hypothetical protein